MKNKSKYFDMASEIDNENFMSFDNFADDSVENFEGQEMLNAEGQTAGLSQPYIVIITNSTTDNVSSVEILNAYDNVSDSGAGAGYTLSFGITGITYLHFLYQTMRSEFTVGLTRLQSTNTSQVLSTYKIETVDSNGNGVYKVITPTTYLNQYLTTQTDDYTNYIVDGATKFTLTTLYASATLNVYLYPSVKINQIGQITNGGATKGYRNPRVSSLGQLK